MARKFGTSVEDIQLRAANEKIRVMELRNQQLEEQYKKLADEHKRTVESVKELISEESLGLDIKVEKAFKLVKENAEITETEE